MRALPTALALLMLATPVLAGGVKDRLAKGEVLVKGRDVTGQSIREVTMTAVIDAPPARLWAIIEDCAGYDRTMQRVKRSRFVGNEGGRILCEITIDMPFPLSDLSSITSALHTAGKDRFKREWKLVRGDYHVNEGSWTLAVFDGNPQRTLVVYKTRVSPKVSIPDSIRDWAQERTLPKLIEHLRAQVAKK